MKWDYAKLSEEAKKNGGPDAYVETIYNSGVSDGKKSMNIFILIAFIFGVCLPEAIRWLWNKCQALKTNSANEIELRRAKEELIQGINDYDNANKDKIAANTTEKCEEE